MTTYSPPVDQLLSYGDARPSTEWPDYLKLGLNQEHVSDLIRMATDEDLHWADSESSEVWALIHAWRALGQMHAEAAIEPLIGLLHRIDEDEDDWVGEELPEVFGMLGSAAIAPLTAYLADATQPLYARIAAASGFEKIGGARPEVRAECVAALSHQLEQLEVNDPTLNAFLVSPLIDLRAVEAEAVIERAFAAHCVDVSIAGDWEDVQIALGLKTTREHPRPRLNPFRYLIPDSPADLPADRLAFPPLAGSDGPKADWRARRQQEAKAKAKCKQAKKARKKKHKK